MPRSSLLFGSCLVLGSVALAWYWQRPDTPHSTIPQPVQARAAQAAQGSPAPAPADPNCGMKAQ